jgi:hypothetical protein
MLRTLGKMFVKTNKIMDETAAPQKPLLYLHEVLIPETCIRLIQEDREGISYDEAQQIMFDSNSFGLYLFPDNEV